MPLVKEVVAHILNHVNAEAADSDPSQVAGVAERAQYVRDAVRSLAADTKDSQLGTTLLAISDDAQRGPKRASFRRAIANMTGSEERSPWLAIHEWVARGRESLDDGSQEEET